MDKDAIESTIDQPDNNLALYKDLFESGLLELTQNSEGKPEMFSYKLSFKEKKFISIPHIELRSVIDEDASIDQILRLTSLNNRPLSANQLFILATQSQKRFAVKVRQQHDDLEAWQTSRFKNYVVIAPAEISTHRLTKIAGTYVNDNRSNLAAIIDFEREYKDFKHEDINSNVLAAGLLRFVNSDLNNLQELRNSFLNLDADSLSSMLQACNELLLIKNAGILNQHFGSKNSFYAAIPEFIGDLALRLSRLNSANHGNLTLESCLTLNKRRDFEISTEGILVIVNAYDYIFKQLPRLLGDYGVLNYEALRSRFMSDPHNRNLDDISERLGKALIERIKVNEVEFKSPVVQAIDKKIHEIAALITSDAFKALGKFRAPKPQISEPRGKRFIRCINSIRKVDDKKIANSSLHPELDEDEEG